MAMNSGCPNVRPRTMVTMPPTTSRIAIQAVFGIRLVTIGVSQAAAP